MRKLNVHFHLNPLQSKKVGTLAESQGQIYFEYDKTWLSQGQNLSPFKLQFTASAQKNSDSWPAESFGLFYDSLPDGWGLLLMDRHFRKLKRSLNQVDLLDRLSYIGNQGMGTLGYEPASESSTFANSNLDLHKIASNATAILEGKAQEVLPEMMHAGGSPGGARPKILAGFDGQSLISGASDLEPGYEAWIIKFHSKEDLSDASKIEYVYYQMLKLAGIQIADSRLFSDNQGHAWFGSRRFDRAPDNQRYFVHTLSNLLHADFRLPSLDYETLFKVCLHLTRDHQALMQCYKLMLFNILSHNRDDHGKNFSFMLKPVKPNASITEYEWHFAPAYDVTFNKGPGGEHSTSVAGAGSSPTISDFTHLANLAGISTKEHEAALEQVQTALTNWTKLAQEFDIDKNTITEIQKHHNMCQANLQQK